MPMTMPTRHSTKGDDDREPAAPAPADGAATTDQPDNVRPREIGGPQGLEPTRYGDWERKGRCIDF